MFDIFDFNGDGKTSFEEEMLGTMLVMGAFGEKKQKLDDGFDDDDTDEDDF